LIINYYNNVKTNCIKLKMQKEVKDMGEQTVAKAFSISSICGESTLRVIILGFIIITHKGRINKIGFIKRKKVLEIV